MKKFSYKNHEECAFNVKDFLDNNELIIIDIQDLQTNEVIKSTVFNVSIESYDPEKNIVILDNYSDNEEMIDFLSTLGVVTADLKCNTEILESDFNDVTVQGLAIQEIFRINLVVLKEYSLNYIN